MPSHILCLRGRRGSYPHARAAMRSGTSREGGRGTGRLFTFRPVLQLRESAFPPSVPVISRPLSKIVQLYLSAGFARSGSCQIKSFPCSLKVAVGVGNLGSSQVRAYLKLMLHLHATLSLIHCHSGLQRPFSAFAQAACSLPLFGPHHFDELNIAAT